MPAPRAFEFRIYFSSRSFAFFAAKVLCFPCFRRLRGLFLFVRECPCCRFVRGIASLFRLFLEIGIKEGRGLTKESRYRAEYNQSRKKYNSEFDDFKTKVETSGKEDFEVEDDLMDWEFAANSLRTIEEKKRSLGV